MIKKYSNDSESDSYEENHIFLSQNSFSLQALAKELKCARGSDRQTPEKSVDNDF